MVATRVSSRVKQASANPLAESLARVGHEPGRMQVHYGLPAASPSEATQWRRCSDLLADPSQFDRWRKRLAEWLATDHPGGIPERTTAGYVMAWYLLVPGFLAGLLFHAARRVPSLRPEDLAFRLGGGRPHPIAIALLAPGFACLPDDPAGSRPEATTVEDEQALAKLLRARYVGHAARFVAAFGPTTRFGRHTLWAAATDAVDTGLWLAGRVCGNEGGGVADATMVLPEHIEPFTAASSLTTVIDEHGHPHWTRRRQSCCFHYALPGQQDNACVTCPRVCADERTRRVLATES